MAAGGSEPSSGSGLWAARLVAMAPPAGAGGGGTRRWGRGGQRGRRKGGGVGVWEVVLVGDTGEEKVGGGAGAEEGKSKIGWRRRERGKKMRLHVLFIYPLSEGVSTEPYPETLDASKKRNIYK